MKAIRWMSQDQGFFFKTWGSAVRVEVGVGRDGKSGMKQGNIEIRSSKTREVKHTNVVSTRNTPAHIHSHLVGSEHEQIPLTGIIALHLFDIMTFSSSSPSSSSALDKAWRALIAW